MSDRELEHEELKYPSIIFKLQEEFYEISSKRMEGIIQLPKYAAVPDSQEYIRGVFKNYGETVLLVDLRSFFSIKTLECEYGEYAELVEEKKKDHIHWINELERSMKEKTRFELAIDPHQCALGIWMDGFSTKDRRIAFRMEQIVEPHRLVHAAAKEIEDLRSISDEREREEAQQRVFLRVKQEYVPKVLQLLDELKQGFWDVYHEMVLLIKGENQLIGLIVDMVVGVEALPELRLEERDRQFYRNSALIGVKQRAVTGEMVFALDELEILRKLESR